MSIGRNVIINVGFVANATGEIEIGNRVLIGPSVKIWSINHQFEDVQRWIQDQGYERKRVVIEEGAWIAMNVTLLPGVTIGKHAIVAAGSVVTKDVEPYHVVGGHPAKTLRVRRDKEIPIESEKVGTHV